MFLRGYQVPGIPLELSTGCQSVLCTLMLAMLPQCDRTKFWPPNNPGFGAMIMQLLPSLLLCCMTLLLVLIAVVSLPRFQCLPALCINQSVFTLSRNVNNLSGKDDYLYGHSGVCCICAVILLLLLLCAFRMNTSPGGECAVVSFCVLHTECMLLLLHLCHASGCVVSVLSPAFSMPGVLHPFFLLTCLLSSFFLLFQKSINLFSAQCCCNETALKV